MFVLAAVVKCAFPIFTESIACSERRQRWLQRWCGGQRSGLGLSGTANPASPGRSVRGSCGSVGGKFSPGGLHTSCNKRSVVRRYWSHEIRVRLISPLVIDFAPSSFGNECQLIGDRKKFCTIEMSKGWTQLFAIPQLWFQQCVKKIWIGNGRLG